MASSEPASTEPPPDDIASRGDSLQRPAAPTQPDQTNTVPPTSPLEMAQLPPHEQSLAATEPNTTNPPAPVEPTSTDGAEPFPPATGASTTSPQQEDDASQDVKGKAPLRSRAASEAIGPHTDDLPAAPLKAVSEDGPAVAITILLFNGQRHLFNVDQRYLRKRNISKEGEEPADPFALSVYTVKELIWKDWRDDWETRPTNPGAIRLIFFGKLLADNQTLRDAKFKDTDPNVVHMSVKPQEFVDDEENAKGEPSSTRGNDGRWNEDAQPGCCRCNVM